MGTGDPPNRFTAPFGDGIFTAHGRLAQRESAAFTRQRSLVRNQHRPLKEAAYLSGKPANERRASEPVGIPSTPVVHQRGHGVLLRTGRSATPACASASLAVPRFRAREATGTP